MMKHHLHSKIAGYPDHIVGYNQQGHAAHAFKYMPPKGEDEIYRGSPSKFNFFGEEQHSCSMQNMLIFIIIMEVVVEQIATNPYWI
jgi:hypothetical protein